MASVSMSMVGVCNPHQMPEREKEKASRNKRKFRADPPPPLPLTPPCTECNGNPNKGFSWKMDCNNNAESSSHGDEQNLGADEEDHGTSANQNHGTCYRLCTLCKALHGKSDSCKCAAILSDPESIRLVPEGPGFSYGDLCSPTGDEEDKDVEADWNDITESQLEELLLSNLDAIYKSAIKRIVAYGHTEEAALKAVLKYGSRCYGSKDTLSNIVDNALGILKSPVDVTSKDHCFEDLQQLEKHVLDEMVCVLREVRPFFSNGDAMWCLLVCDLNVAHACAMDDDAFNTLNKDSVPGNSPVESPEKASESTSPSMPPSFSNCMPTFKSGSSSLPSGTQEMDSSIPSMPFIGRVPSFSMGAFPMPNKGSCKVHTKTGSWEKVGVETSQLEKVRHHCRVVESKLACAMHMEAVSSSGRFHYSSNFTVDCDAKSAMSSMSHMMAEECVLTMGQPFQSMKNIAFGATEDEAKFFVSDMKGSSGAVFSSSGSSSKMDRLEPNEIAILKMHSAMKASLSEGIQNPGKSRTNSSSSSSTTCSTFTNQNLESFTKPMEFLSKQINQQRENESATKGSKRDAGTTNNSSSFAGAGTDLSLSLATAGDASSDAINDSVSSIAEAANFNYDVASLDEFFGGNISQDQKDEMILKMYNRAKYLETQICEWNEWAQEKVMQAARRLSTDKAELKSLRQEKEEAIRLKKGRQTLEESTMKKLSEMESALRKASGQVECANAEVRRLEVENIHIRREMDAAKIAASKSAASCQEALKREKKASKRFEAWEKQKSVLQEELASEKRKLLDLQNQLVKGKEQLSKLEVRLKQEEKAKEEAINKLEAEKLAKQDLEASVKQREEALLQKEEADTKRYRDDIQRLEREIAQLRLRTESSKLAALQWGPGYSRNSSNSTSIEFLKQMNARLQSEIKDLSQKEIQRDRECVMCLSEEMSVVFLPCAHQVVCKNCNDVHEEQGMKDCPSCRTLIQQRVHVNMS